MEEVFRKTIVGECLGRVTNRCDEEGVGTGEPEQEEITERKQADALLHEIIARNRAILKALPDLMFLTTEDGVFLDYHAKERDVLFVPPEQFIGKNIREVLPEELAQALARCFEQAARSDEPVIHEYSLPLGDAKGYYEARVVSCDRGRVLSIVRDITERKRHEAALLASEESLHRSHARIQDLAGKLITAQEEERKHLSRELHDDLNQKLASLANAIGYLKRHLHESVSFINHHLTDLEGRIFSLSNDIRQLSHELHPAVLEHIGLHMALESYCTEFSGREGIQVALDIEEGISEIQPRIALCLYRIAQEALRNVAKHSGATSAHVTLSAADGGIRLIISDQGVGYDYSQARAKGGLGLISMEERVRLLGGSFQVITQPHKGTVVLVQISTSQRW
jgi:PAS domain S-box-containing protein